MRTASGTGEIKVVQKCAEDPRPYPIARFDLRRLRGMPRLSQRSTLFVRKLILFAPGSFAFLCAGWASRYFREESEKCWMQAKDPHTATVPAAPAAITTISFFYQPPITIIF